MDLGLVDSYGNYIKKKIPDDKEKAYSLIKLGLHYEKFRTKHLQDKKMPAAYRYLNTYAVSEVLNGLKHPEKTVWANLFSPVEILQNFGVHTLSVETLSSFLSGFTIEDVFLDHAENEGIAPTLCSYHKNFIGAVDSGVIPPAKFAVTTSTICDGNINTFRLLGGKHNIPCYLIDVPESYSSDASEYVVEQLKELISILEDTFGKKFNEDELKKTIIRENLSKESYERSLRLLAHKKYPSTLTLQMYMLFANHVNIGTQEVLAFYKQLESELNTAEEFTGLNFYWVHLLPFYQQTLKGYFNLSDKYQIIGTDLSLDYREPLDPEKPLESLAKKMILNIYTGSYSRKADMIKQLAEELHPDGIINFCHWGCKQSSGGAQILKETLKDTGVPFITLDGDALDRRNSHDGQIKTRFEAFLEVVKQHKGEHVC